MRQNQQTPTTSPRLRADAAQDPSLNLAAVQVVDIVSHVIRALDARDNRVHLVIERTPTVVADGDKLAHVMSSLLQSALERLGEGGYIEAAVAARCLASDRGPEGPVPPHSAHDEPCEPAVSVAIGDFGTSSGEGPATPIPHLQDTGTGTPASAMSIENILALHKGALWYRINRRQQRTLGFCLNSLDQAA